MKLASLSQPALAFIARNMRAEDRREIMANRWGDDEAELVEQCLQGGAFAWVVGLDEPIAAIGAYPLWPGVWSVWMFATDDFPRIGIRLTRWVRRVMIPALRDSGCHRAECHSIEGHRVAHRWLESLGARHEATLRCYGREGEDFRVYSWIEVGNVRKGRR